MIDIFEVQLKVNVKVIVWIANVRLLPRCPALCFDVDVCYPIAEKNLISPIRGANLAPATLILALGAKKKKSIGTSRRRD